MAKASPKPHALVARNLHALRLRADMTQEVLAERADVDLRSLQRIEAGAWNMTVDYLARFQKALGCRWRDLIEGLDTPTVMAAKNAKGGKMEAKKGPHIKKRREVTSKWGLKRGRTAKPAAKRGRA